jgi:hypothetical protein
MARLRFDHSSIIPINNTKNPYVTRDIKLTEVFRASSPTGIIRTITLT